jgi:hypothetical protein
LGFGSNRIRKKDVACQKEVKIDLEKKKEYSWKMKEQNKL